MNVALLSTDLTPAPSEKAYIEITKAIKIEIAIVLKFIFLLKLLTEIKTKARLAIKIPIIPKKGITSFKKIKDKIVTKIGAHPRATG